MTKLTINDIKQALVGLNKIYNGVSIRKHDKYQIVLYSQQMKEKLINSHDYHKVSGQIDVILDN